MTLPFKKSVLLYSLTIYCLLFLLNCSKEEIKITDSNPETFLGSTLVEEDAIHLENAVNYPSQHIKLTEYLTETPNTLSLLWHNKGRTTVNNPTFFCLDLKDLAKLEEQDFQVNLHPIFGNPSLFLYGHDVEGNRNKWRKVKHGTQDKGGTFHLNFKKSAFKDSEEFGYFVIFSNKHSYFEVELYTSVPN